jgi:hypothetical protein
VTKPDWLADFVSDVAPYLPPGFGAYLGLYWAKNQTPSQKAMGFVGGFGLAVWFGPAVAEWFSLGPKATIAVGVLIAVAGMDILGGIMAAAKAFSVDPMASIKSWWSVWRGGQS